MKTTAYLFLLFAFFTSCREREAQLDIPPYEPKLVVNALLTNEEEFRIQVSKSVSSLSQEEPEFLDDALIELRANGVLTPSFVYEPFDKVYELAQKPEPGVRYDLIVNHPNFPQSVVAQTILPQGVQIGNLSFNDSVGLDSTGTNLGELSFTIADPQGTANFYRLSMLYYSLVQDQFIPFKFGTSDAVLLSPETVELDDGSFQFDDKLFNGQTRTFKVQFSASLAINTPRYLVQVEALSEDYFKYINSIELFDQSGNNPFREPVFIHSNVTGGLGIFAGALMLRDTLY